MGLVLMTSGATPINVSGIVEWNDLGTVLGNTADVSAFHWRPFPIQIEGPFGSQVIIECSQNWQPSSQFLSWFLLRLVLNTSQGPKVIEPAQELYPTARESLVSFQIPAEISSIGWNSGSIEIKGRVFNSPKFVPSATTWEVTARQGIVREKLTPLVPSLVKRINEQLQELRVTEKGELILVEPN